MTVYGLLYDLIILFPLDRQVPIGFLSSPFQTWLPRFPLAQIRISEHILQPYRGTEFVRRPRSEIGEIMLVSTRTALLPVIIVVSADYGMKVLERATSEMAENLAFKIDFVEFPWAAGRIFPACLQYNLKPPIRPIPIPISLPIAPKYSLVRIILVEHRGQIKGRLDSYTVVTAIPLPISPFGLMCRFEAAFVLHPTHVQ